MAAALHSNAEIFAANRATGHIALACGGARRPHAAHARARGRLAARALSEHHLGCAGSDHRQHSGRHGGRRSVRYRHQDRRRSHLIAGTAAAEKIYRSLGPPTEVDVSLDIGAGGRLAWLPQETILFDRARLSRRIDVDLAADASLVLAEALVFGRSAMGEAVRGGLARRPLARPARRAAGVRRERAARRRDL